MTLKRHNGTFELTLSLFIVVILSLGAAVWGVVPEIKTNLRLQEESRTDSAITVRLQAEYDRLYALKETTEADAAALTEQFENPADVASLLAWIKTVWQNGDVTAEGTSGVFNVQGRADSPTAFYRFVQQLDGAPWVLALDVPVRMQAQEGGIVIAFALRPVTSVTAPAPLQN